MSILQSYILYYFLVIFTTLIVFISGKLSQGNNKSKLGAFFFWIALILPVLISGLRYGLGTDYFSYEDIYYRLTTQGNIINDILNTRYEPGWILLNYTVKLLFDDVKYLFLISSFLIWFFNFKAIYDNRTKISISIAILILLSTLFNPSFNMIRQSLAASILMLSIEPITNKKRLKFYLTIFLATSFHYTAIIFIPAYWIANSRRKSSGIIKKMLVIIGSVLVVILAPRLLSFITSFDSFSSYDHYNLDFESFGVGNIVIKMPIILIILFNLNKLKSNNPISKIVLFYFIGLILEYYGYFANYVNRIAIYYEMMQVFILSAIIKVQNNKYEKLLYSFLIVIYFLSWYTYNFIILNRHETIPYTW